jgi:hypothetical protein
MAFINRNTILQKPDSINVLLRIPNIHGQYKGSVVILGEFIFLNPFHAYTLANLKRKNFLSATPLNEALNAFILALKASAAAFVLLFTKKFNILS